MGVGRPAVTIRLALEERPCVVVDALDEGEQARIIDWIDSRPELAELVARALEAEERAA